MEFDGKYVIHAPRNDVWRALNDPETLKTAIPGCQAIHWISDTELEAEIAVNLGVVKPVFKGDLTLSDVIPAQQYTLTGRGRGGLLGRASGTAKISLADHPDGTSLIFTAEGGASGQIMRLGRAIVGSSAQKIIDRFFERFAKKMGVDITVESG